MNLDRRMRDLAQGWGVDYYGVADLSPAYDVILAQGGSEIAGYPTAISIGIGLLNSLVNQLPRRREREVAVAYMHHAYAIVNQQLDLITLRLSNVVQREGYHAQPIPASRKVDHERQYAVISNKIGAHLAGLGWIGKNCLLITPEVGPRVRWATVLTDAPLSTTGDRIQDQCGDCVECVEACPVNAFTGEPFRADEPREIRYDALKCYRYFNRMEEKDPDIAVCGLCLYVCPFGKK